MQPPAAEMQSKQTDPLRYLLLAATILVYLVVVLGGILRVSGTEAGCTGWPLCSGSWLPAGEPGSLAAYLHRLVTLVAAPMVFASAWMAWRQRSGLGWITLPVYGAGILLIGQILLGRAIAITSSSGEDWATALHLGLSLLILAGMTLAAVAVFIRQSWPLLPERLDYRNSFGRLSLLAAGAIFALMVSGALVTGAQATPACPAWPLCSSGLIPASASAWLNVAHRLIVFATALLVTWLLLRAWRTQRYQTGVLFTAAGRPGNGNDPIGGVLPEYSEGDQVRTVRAHTWRL